MTNEEDYYQILGVTPEAINEQIKEAYLYKVNILHPDRLDKMPEKVRRLAEEEIKKVNLAYEVLSNPQKRKQYDQRRLSNIESNIEIVRDSKKRPFLGTSRPEVHPKTIKFDKVLPWVKQRGSFFIRNVGGRHKKVFISEPPEWLKIVKITSLQGHSKLPLQVYIEAMAIQWGKTYSTEIIVRLDESEAKVKVKLHTQRKPH